MSILQLSWMQAKKIRPPKVSQTKKQLKSKDKIEIKVNISNSGDNLPDHELDLIEGKKQEHESEDEAVGFDKSVQIMGQQIMLADKVIEFDDSVQFVQEIDFNMKTGKPIEMNLCNDTSYFEQISRQITIMVGAVLQHSEIQEQMEFQLKNNTIGGLHVVKTKGDGNCLFSALSHQLYGDPMNSSIHVQKTKKLREAVVNYTLHPERFQTFESIVKDRVLGSKRKKNY